jgi:hypothetical protein
MEADVHGANVMSSGPVPRTRCTSQAIDQDAEQRRLLADVTSCAAKTQAIAGLRLQKIVSWANECGRQFSLLFQKNGAREP